MYKKGERERKKRLREIFSTILFLFLFSFFLDFKFNLSLYLIKGIMIKFGKRVNILIILI